MSHLALMQLRCHKSKRILNLAQGIEKHILPESPYRRFKASQSEAHFNKYNKNKDEDSFIKRRQVFLKDTPRALASIKPQKNELSVLNKKENKITLLKDTPRANASIINNSPEKLRRDTAGDKSPQQQQPIVPPYTDQTEEKITQHCTTHFLKGGTPCDPVTPPYKLANYGEESVYTLVLLRHGESEWNKENRYTGWCDVNLTKRGKEEARDAGRLLKENGVEIDHAFTSVLRRAGGSTNMALAASDQFWVPVTKSWRLNERHYGALQGYNKDTAYQELDIDQELVMEMRRSYETRPPPMSDDHEHWHGNDRRYKNLTGDQLELTRAESLHDTANRILPFFNSVIIPSLVSGNKCLVVSHANTIRTLIKHIDNISDEDIKSMSIPTGIPLLYRLDKNLKPVDPNIELEFRYMVEPKGYTWATSHQYGFHGVYLGDLERLQEIQRKRDVTNRDWQRIILRNLAKSVDMLDYQVGFTHHVIETRQLWWAIYEKMQQQEFSNMLLLENMKGHLERCMYERKHRYLTWRGFENILAKVHLDAEGQLVEPFVDLRERDDREERAKKWQENVNLDLEENCLIK